MRLIVLTGGIACGKTTTSNYLSSKHECVIIDADEIAHDVQQPGRPAWQAVVSHFGRTILNPDDTIDRKKLGALVFKDPTELRVLNQIVHPRVIRELFSKSVKAWLSRKSVVILDIPLFFEGNLPRVYFHDIVVVVIEREAQVERIMNRNHISREDAERRIAAQMPIERKSKLGTIVVRNDGTREELEKTLDGLVLNWQNGSWLTYLPDPLLIVAVLVIVILTILIVRWR
jgi:dephospho-CoA kinase